ncbi:transmembrane protease serine 11D-like [Schistocerca cancellata]|uniref:transmembrane protease serine 11D-like n=1 Tax=Schistocerca cancellata TaxID=274614 RepID=UPI0021187596|nr:transmembrane protease serine 11D-like [Schistocerca cancellata]
MENLLLASILQFMKQQADEQKGANKALNNFTLQISASNKALSEALSDKLNNSNKALSDKLNVSNKALNEALSNSTNELRDDITIKLDEQIRAVNTRFDEQERLEALETRVETAAVGNQALVDYMLKEIQSVQTEVSEATGKLENRVMVFETELFSREIVIPPESQMREVLEDVCKEQRESVARLLNQDQAVIQTMLEKDLPWVKKELHPLNASISDYPYQASLLRGGSHHCGASIISETWTLTAAHYVEFVPASELGIGAETTTRDSGGTVHSALSVTWHKSYLYYAYDYDIAVVQISDSFPLGANVQVVNLAAADYDPPGGLVATLTVWGSVQFNGDEADTLK